MKSERFLLHQWNARNWLDSDYYKVPNFRTGTMYGLLRIYTLTFDKRKRNNFPREIRKWYCIISSVFPFFFSFHRNISCVHIIVKQMNTDYWLRLKWPCTRSTNRVVSYALSVCLYLPHVSLRTLRKHCECSMPIGLLPTIGLYSIKTKINFRQ
jgi:hypothetical protein